MPVPQGRRLRARGFCASETHLACGKHELAGWKTRGAEQWVTMGQKKGIDCSKGAKGSVLPPSYPPAKSSERMAIEVDLEFVSPLCRFPKLLVLLSVEPVLKQMLLTSSRRAAGGGKQSRRTAPAQGYGAAQASVPALRGGSSGGAAGGSVAGAEPACESGARTAERAPDAV